MQAETTGPGAPGSGGEQRSRARPEKMRSRTTGLDGQSEVQVLMVVLFEEAAMRQAFALKHRCTSLRSTCGEGG